MIEKRSVCVEDGRPSNAYNLPNKKRIAALETLQQEILTKIKDKDINEINARNNPNYFGNKVITPLI